jgi:hypothetical protein
MVGDATHSFREILVLVRLDVAALSQEEEFSVVGTFPCEFLCIAKS